MSDYGDDFADDAQDEGLVEPTPDQTLDSTPPTPGGAAQPSLAQMNSKINALQSKVTSLNSQNKSLSSKLTRSEAMIKQMQENNKKEENLGELLFEKSQELVDQASKNLDTANKLETTKQKLADVNSAAAQFREILFSGINGGVTDVDHYKNISLSDLLRLRLQEADKKAEEAVAEAKSSAAISRSAPSATETLPRQMASSGGGGEGGDDDATKAEIDGIQKLEAELTEVKTKNVKLSKQYDGMKVKLESAFEAVNRFKDIQTKVAVLSERSRNEKDLRSRTQSALSLSNKKVEALSDHIEKLMLHLKHEATSKAKAYEAKAKANKEAELLRARNNAILKKNNGRERVIVELKEGAKILEDQLRLMDEKYMELRTKLDWTRLQSERTLKKSQHEASTLRKEMAMSRKREREDMRSTSMTGL
ncbi:hypothetical protein TrRE_jg6960 [Triparma retinervis]|uniref:Uncharacterized protein n=1 Tax=Triparma retinervis TaxID=2557542 RepID=A0A9W6ZMU1_9STRA|nr:hypothetical protein TrRE_jg6960 [Triparma retinervis]